MKIILCPGSAENQKFKRWPIIKFNQLGKELLALGYDISIVLGPEEGYLSSSFSEFKIEQVGHIFVCFEHFKSMF